MNAFPVFVNLQNQRVLLVGATPAAEAKLRLLLNAGAEPVVVAADPPTAFYDWAYEGAIRLESRDFDAADLDEARLAVVATGDDALDAHVAEAATARNVPVNVVDNRALSTFIVPSIVDRGDIVIGISTNGCSPTLAQQIRGQVEALLPPQIERLAAFADRFRTIVAERIEDHGQRRTFWQAFFESDAAQAVLAGDEDRAEAIVWEQIERQSLLPGAGGSVAIVGAGPGSADLLTMRAHRLLRAADAIVYDNLVGPDVLDLARRDAERIYVGKARGTHSWKQDDINALLADLAGQGKRVVRLKGGDPFVFGRGGEEVAFLTARNIDVDIVPGITAATACAAIGGFPLTHRDHASAVTFLSGQGKEGSDCDYDWAALARPGQTIVVYMGVAAAETIAQRLIENGLPANTPVALVERGSLPDERRIFGELAGLGALIEDNDVRPPTLIVIGSVVQAAASRAAVADLAHQPLAAE